MNLFDLTNLKIITQKWGESLTRYNLIKNGGILILDIRHTKIPALPQVKIGDGYLWNLTVGMGYRRKGMATELMKKAEEVARVKHCKRLWLEWNKKEAPKWVYDWYCRLGYEEKVFGDGYALMYKEL